MNWKLILAGGLMFYVVQFAFSMVTGPVIHEGMLDPHYAATDPAWRPELRAKPPQLEKLIPYWIASGLVFSFVVAAFYGQVRGAFSGGGAIRGLKFGLWISVFTAALYAVLHGFFNLPATIWVAWSLEGLGVYAASGAALGAISQKVAPVAT